MALAPKTMSIPHAVKLNTSALAFTLVLSVATGLLFGLVPAARVTNASLNESLRGAVRRRIPFSVSDFLVMAEVALALVLVSSAGLLLKSFLRLTDVNPGFDAGKLITAQISLGQAQYQQNYQSAAFFNQLLDRVAALPAVSSVSVTSRLPVSGAGSGARGGDPFSIEGRPYNGASRTPQVVNYQVVGLNYFRTMQIRILAGRDFEPQDSEASTPVVIINDTMARGFWPGKSPLGQRITLGAPRPGKPWLTITGVVNDVRNSSLDVTPIPQMYVPFQQNPLRSMTIVLRAQADPLDLVKDLRREALALDPNQPVYDVNTMEQRLAGSVSQPRFRTVLLEIFATLALLLGAVGISGVVSHSVAERTREIGIRMALGAQRGDVVKNIVKGSSRSVLAGIAAGLAASLALSRLLSSFLFGVRPKDPWVLIGAAAISAVVAILAGYIPARRATKIDPVIALRYE
jgi:putative ABC transport system permease protein